MRSRKPQLATFRSPCLGIECPSLSNAQWRGRTFAIALDVPAVIRPSSATRADASLLTSSALAVALCDYSMLARFYLPVNWFTIERVSYAEPRCRMPGSFA